MRTLAAAALLILFAATSAAAQNGEQADGYQSSQGWLGRDKQLHFGISAVASAGLFAVGVEVGLARWQSAAVSAAVVGAAGVWREIGTADRQNLLTRQKLSRRDLVWDAVGIGVGLAATELYYRARGRREERLKPHPVPVPSSPRPSPGVAAEEAG